MGYIKMTHRKVLRRSRPHGQRRKRIEPTVEQGFRDIQDEQDGWWDDFDDDFMDTSDDAYDEREDQLEDHYPNKQTRDRYEDYGISEIDLIGGES